MKTNFSILSEITVNIARAEISTGRTCEPERWNSKTGKVIGKEEYSSSYNFAGSFWSDRTPHNNAIHSGVKKFGIVLSGFGPDWENFTKMQAGTLSLIRGKPSP